MVIFLLISHKNQKIQTQSFNLARVLVQLMHSEIVGYLDVEGSNRLRAIGSPSRKYVYMLNVYCETKMECWLFWVPIQQPARLFEERSAVGVFSHV